MHKNIILSLVLSLGLILGITMPVSAIEDEIEVYNAEFLPECTTIDYTTQEAAEAACENAQNALEEGLSSESEVVCASEDEEGCEPGAEDYIDELEGETADDEEEETAMWPVWLSFGAIGVMIVLVLIINLSGRKKK